MNNQKKLIVGVSYEGTVNLLDGQLQYFHELGYKTYLISPYSQRAADFCKRENCELIPVPIKREISLISDIINLIRILIIIIRIKPDVLNLGTPKVSLLGLIAGWFARVPNRIYTCRGYRFEHEKGLKRAILITMEKITAKCAHQVLCISPSVRDLGVSLTLFPINKTRVIHYGSSNGINLNLFNPELISEHDKENLINELQLKDKFIFGFIGRIVERKGIAELIEAFDNIYQTNQNCRLLLVGMIEESQISDKSIITKIKEHPGIVYAGRKLQGEVPPLMSIIDLFVLPAWWEGFGNVLVQAAALGVPVITTNATGTKDAVSDNFNGIIVPKYDTKALINAMNLLLTNNEIREKFGKNGKIWASNFNNKIIWEGINYIYLNN